MELISLKAQHPIFIFTASLHWNVALPRNYRLLLTPCSKYLHKALSFRLALSKAPLRCFASTCRRTNERAAVFEMPLLVPASNPSSVCHSVLVRPKLNFNSQSSRPEYTHNKQFHNKYVVRLTVDGDAEETNFHETFQVIRMLFVVVAEFFVCWAPVHIMNTLCLFYRDEVYSYIGSTGISLIHLVSYMSSCCNPITYCFMNRKFRQAFLGVFSCCR